MNFEALVKHISTIQNTLQAQAAHAVNLALTSRNWLMGCYIVEFEQNGEDRAAYGEQLLKKLEQRLKTKGLNERRFREFRRLYLVYPQLKEPVTQYIASQIQIRQSLTAEFTEPIRRLVTAESENGVWKLSTEYPQTETWMIPADRLFNRLSSTHLNTISGIENPVKRAFYEMETIRGCWSVKELERQIASLYYERSGLSKNKEALSALVQQQAILLQPKDVINTPVTLEFLGLNERALVTENDLEQSILDNLQRFLLEMGHGFCFEARQKRILIDEDYFFADTKCIGPPFRNSIDYSSFFILHSIWISNSNLINSSIFAVVSGKNFFFKDCSFLQKNFLIWLWIVFPLPIIKMNVLW